MQTTLLFAVLSLCISFNEGKPLEDETCIGVLRKDSSYDFDLPNVVALNILNPACDAEWTIDQIYTAILEGNSRHFSHPFKKLTRNGISASYCPASVRFHVSCPKYTNNLNCSCLNSTISNNPPSTETSSAMKPGLLKRQHYLVCASGARQVCQGDLICKRDDR